VTNTTIAGLAKAFLLLIPLTLPQIRPEVPPPPSRMVSHSWHYGVIITTRFDSRGLSRVEFTDFPRTVKFDLR
jgi:hypothetical protein